MHKTKDEKLGKGFQEFLGLGLEEIEKANYPPETKLIVTASEKYKVVVTKYYWFYEILMRSLAKFSACLKTLSAGVTCYLYNITKEKGKHDI